MDNLKEATLQSELRFKDLIINPCHRSVLINNNRIDLTTKEFDLLYFLAIHPGWAFTKSQIYETVWLMAKHQNPDVPDTPEDWLDQFNTFSIYEILPQIIELWGLNVEQQVTSKKNIATLSGK